MYLDRFDSQNQEEALMRSITARPSRESPVLITTNARVPNINHERCSSLAMIASPKSEIPKPTVVKATTE